MGTAEEIAIKLGVKPGDLKAVLADAGASIKKFKKDGESKEDEGFMGQIKGIKKSLNGMKDVILAGGVATAVLGFFEKAFAEAKKTEGAIDDNTAATLRMAEQFDRVKELFAGATVTLTGWFVQLGEGIGKLAGGLIYGKEAVKDAEALLKLEAEKVLAKEKQKAIDEKLKSIGEQITAEAKRTADLKNKALTDSERLAKAEADLFKATQLLANAGEDQVRRQNALLNVKKAQNDVLSAQMEIAKKTAQEEEKAAEAARKLAIERYDAETETLSLTERRARLIQEEIALKEFLALVDQDSVDFQRESTRLLEVQNRLRGSNNDQAKANVEIAALLLKGQENLNDVERERLRVLTGQTTEEKQQAEIGRLLAQGVENLTDEDRARLRVLIGQTAELKNQGKEIDENARKQAAFNALTSRGLQSTGNPQNLNDTQLNQLLQNVTKQLDQSRREDSTVSGVFGKYTSPITYQLQQELERLKTEIGARSNFQRTQDFFGDEYAQRNYAPDEYDRLSRLINPDQAKQQADDIAALRRAFEAAGFRG